MEQTLKTQKVTPTEMTIIYVSHMINLLKGFKTKLDEGDYDESYNNMHLKSEEESIEGISEIILRSKRLFNDEIYFRCEKLWVELEKEIKTKI